MEKFFTAIIYTKDNTFLKYRNIRNYSHNDYDFYNPKFVAFVASKQGISVNLYYKENKQFFKQIKLL
jgi:hypothetical protein